MVAGLVSGSGSGPGFSVFWSSCGLLLGLVCIVCNNKVLKVKIMGNFVF